MSGPEFLRAVRTIMTDARTSSSSGKFILHYEGLVQVLVEDHDLFPGDVHDLLFEATLAGDLIVQWRDGNAYPFVLLPKEGISQDA